MNELHSIRTVEDEKSLQHYGVLGMKWGVHRNSSMPRSPRSYKKKLNKLEKQTSKQMSKIIRNETTGYKKIRKAELYSEKHDWDNMTSRQSKKAAKMYKKSDKYFNRYKDARKDYSRLKTETNKLIKEAMSKGYTVNSKQVIRTQEIGRTYIDGFLFGASGVIGGYALAAKSAGNRYATDYRGKTYNQTAKLVVGNKHNVKKKKV